MTERPILFSAPMVRAILDGRKTQTRRVLKPPMMRVPYAPGDTLWVRETFATHFMAENRIYPKGQGHAWGSPIYGATYGAALNPQCEGFSPWRPSIHMPRWASRITLRVTDVRVQRVQEISEGDVYAEGAITDEWLEWREDAGNVGLPEGSRIQSERDVFQNLWNSLHGIETCWDANPWVAAITFERIKP